METIKRFAARVATEQLIAVYRQLPTTVTAVMGAGLLIFILWDIHPHDLLLGWFGAVFAINGIFGWVLYLGYRKYCKGVVLHPRWKVLFLSFAFCTGIVWGSIGVIFYPAPVEYKLLIVVWLWALGSGMATLLVAYKPAFYTMVTLLLLPLAARAAVDGDNFHLGLSAATLLWMITLIYFHHGNFKTLMEATNLRFLNDELVDELTRRNEEAERANHAKSQFLAAASHDLRQPLHAQGLFLAELDRHVDSAIGRRILGGLESSIYAMRKLLNAILDISKLDAGVVEPSIKPCAIDTILRELKLEFEPQAAEKGIELGMEPSGLSVITDPVLLGSILRNLVANAIRYTRQGRVGIDCRRQGDSLIIQVQDTGAGIPEQSLDDIFSPFVQLGNPERDREKGLGLGLSIVHRTSLLLDHPVSLTSEVGKGTVFSIVIPISTETIRAFDKETLAPTGEVNIEGIRVLVIDDDQDVCTGMLGLLRSWGCLPVAVGTIGAASEASRQNEESIDIILADFRLPDNTTGIQAIEAVRKQAGSAIPAALITGDTSIDRLREAKESGCPVLHKPVLANELRILIGKLAG